ncbi:MAG: prepilin-type N-terminal cleavage/methylation domain-containing protein [Planctomycetota bacterium]
MSRVANLTVLGSFVPSLDPHRSPDRHRDTASSRRRSGFSIVEVMVSVVIVTVAVYILTSTVTAAVSHSIVKRQRTLAVEAAMNVIERMRALPPEDVFALFNEDAADDPYGQGTGFGPLFDVEGLDGLLDENGEELPVGQVLLPGDGSILDESADQPEFGLPRDLDGNLVIEAGDCADRYIVLPVLVRVEWMSRLGPRRFDMATMVVDLAKLEE